MQYSKWQTSKLVALFLTGALVALILQWVVVDYGPAPDPTSAKLFYEDFRAYVHTDSNKSISHPQLVRSLQVIEPYLLGEANGLESYFNVIGAGPNNSALNQLVQDVQAIPTNQLGNPRIERHLNQALSLLKPLAASKPTRQQIDHALALLNTSLASTHW